MTNTDQKADICASGDRMNWSKYIRKGQAELEKVDIQEGHEYLPMDVYVDPREKRAHFQSSPILERWKRMH